MGDSSMSMSSISRSAACSLIGSLIYIDDPSNDEPMPTTDFRIAADNLLVNSLVAGGSWFLWWLGVFIWSEIVTTSLSKVFSELVSDASLFYLRGAALIVLDFE